MACTVVLGIKEDVGTFFGVGPVKLAYKPRPPKGSKKWNPLIILWFLQCSNGFILGGFHLLDPLGGLGMCSTNPRDPSI